MSDQFHSTKTLPQDKLDIDLLKAEKNQIDINVQKYPVDKAKGNAKEYTEPGL